MDHGCWCSTMPTMLVFSLRQRHLSKYLPPSRHGSVLITSRTRRAAMQMVENSDVILIEPMHDAAAHALLHRKLGDKVDRSDGIAELAAALDYMPLALVQAAAYIRERAPRCSVRQYLGEYRQSDSRKTSLLNQEAGHLRRDEAASNSVLVTWQISFDHLRSTRKSSADLLSLMSFFDRQGIQESLLHSPSSTANNDDFEQDVVTLRDYSFITATKDKETLEMHSLIQLATRTWLENQGQLDKWREQFISNLSAELPIGEHENWEKCKTLFPHARVAMTQRPKGEEMLKKWASLLYKAAWYALRRGRVDETEQMSIISMEVRRAVLGEEHADTLSSMEMVASAIELKGKYKEAEAINRQTLARKEKVLGPEHLATLLSMSNLAVVLIRQEKYKEAEAITRQTLAQYNKVLGPDHQQTLINRGNLALALERQGNYEEAEAIDTQTLAQKEKVLGPEHPTTLTSMSNLALVLDRRGKCKEAEAMNRQTLARREKVLGPAHPDTLASVYCLAHLLAKQRCYKESLTLYERACAGYDTTLGNDHPATRACRKHYDEAKSDATEKQRVGILSPVIPNSSVSAHASKVSKLSRGLAKIGIHMSTSRNKGTSLYK